MKYIIKEDPTTGGAVGEELVGKVVYDQLMHDYGLARDDTNAYGVEHITVTFNKDGSYPGFTIPLHVLDPIKETPLNQQLLDKLLSLDFSIVNYGTGRTYARWEGKNAVLNVRWGDDLKQIDVTAVVSYTTPKINIEDHDVYSAEQIMSWNTDIIESFDTDADLVISTAVQEMVALVSVLK